MKTTGKIFDIKKYAIHDGPGIRTTVFFKGCPLHCWWCHNPESREVNTEFFVKEYRAGCAVIEFEQAVGQIMTAEEIFEEINKDSIFYDDSGGGVTFSGGEPLLQSEFLSLVLSLTKEHGIHSAVDTSGYVRWDDFNRINDLVDLYLYDLKIMDDTEHLKYVGVSNKTIHDNLKRLVSEGKKVIIRVPLIPGITDTDKNINAICLFLSFLTPLKRIDILPYNIFTKNKYKRFNKLNQLNDLISPSEQEINKIAEKFELFGFETKIGG
jgi:pyruvate formate lyase activating enzyme